VKAIAKLGAPSASAKSAASSATSLRFALERTREALFSGRDAPLAAAFPGYSRK
jgi:hypothetical protein